jgi:hypothetical protein
MANIFSQFMAPPKSVGEFGAEMQQAQGNKLALAFKRMQQQQAEQGMADDQAFRGLTQQYRNNPNALAEAAMGKGLYEQAQKVQGNIATAAKGKSDLDTAESARKKTELESTLKRMEYGASILSTAKDPQSYAVALQTMEQAFPGSTQQMPQQFDPQDVAARLAAGQTIKDKIAGELSRSTLDQTIVRDTNSNNNAVAGQEVTMRGQDLSSASAAAGRSVAIRGQNLTNERAREGSWTMNNDTGYMVNSRTGEYKMATGPDGKPSSRPVKMTEVQGKATGFASRMMDAEKTLNKFEDKVSAAGVAMAGYKSEFPKWMPGGQIIGGALTAANKTLNPMVSDEAMAYQQAQANWVTANLRLESGAVIGVEEMQKEIEKYFPQPGEPKSVIAQKKAARAVAQRAVTAQSGPGASLIPGIANPESRAAPDSSGLSDPLGLR